MNPKKRITEAEWLVMRPLWKRSPQTAQELIHAVAEENDWSPRTVKALLNRLIQKEVLGFSKDGRRYEYYPLMKEAECIASEADSFLSRVFGGACEPMFAHFVEHEDLSDEQIDRLQEILNEKRTSNTRGSTS